MFARSLPVVSLALATLAAPLSASALQRSLAEIQVSPDILVYDVDGELDALEGGYGTFDPNSYCESSRDYCRTFCNAEYQFSDQTPAAGVNFYDCYTGCEEQYGSCLDFYR